MSSQIQAIAQGLEVAKERTWSFLGFLLNGKEPDFGIFPHFLWLPCAVIPQYLEGFVPGPPQISKSMDAQVPYISSIVFAYDLYLHTGYSKVCLALYSCGIKVVLSAWQIQVCLFFIFVEIF